MRKSTILIAEKKFKENAILIKSLKKNFSKIIIDTNNIFSKNKKMYENVDGIILGLQDFNRNEISYFKNLKIITKFGVGLDNIDVDFCLKKKIKVLRASGCNSIAVAELVIGNIINLIRNINENNNLLKKFKWQPIKGLELYKKKVGIIGLGTIGKEVALRLEAFKCTISYHDIKRDLKFEKENNLRAVSLNKILKESDIITLHTPLTPKTLNLISHKELKIMKENAIIINTSRGKVINLKDLSNIIRKKNLKIALDVYEPEPFLEKKLLTVSNAIFTPHIGGTTEEAIMRIGKKNILDLKKYLK